MGKKRLVNRGNKRAATGLTLPMRGAALASQGYFGGRTRTQPEKGAKEGYPTAPDKPAKKLGQQAAGALFSSASQR